MRPLIGALITVYFRSSAVRLASALAAAIAASAVATAATDSSYSSCEMAPVRQQFLVAGELRFRQLEVGRHQVDASQRLLVDRLVFVGLDREQRLPFFDVVAVLEVDRLQVAEDTARTSTISEASVWPVYSSESTISCSTTAATVTKEWAGPRPRGRRGRSPSKATGTPSTAPPRERGMTDQVSHQVTRT